MFRKSRRGWPPSRPTTRLQTTPASDDKTSEPYLAPSSVSTSGANDGEQIWTAGQGGASINSPEAAANNAHGLGKSLMPPPPIPRASGHQPECPHSKWEMSPLLKDEEVRSGLLNHFMGKKSWNNENNVAEADRKCDEALRDGGPIKWYLQSQRELYDEYRKKDLLCEECTCSGGRADEATNTSSQ